MRSMRAKMKITSVNSTEYSDTLTLTAVSKDGPYPADGSDEDNTFAKFSPSGKIELQVANPDLRGKFKAGQKFYVDFTEVPDQAQAAEKPAE